MSFQTNPSQVLGLAFFAFAGLACAHAARRRSSPWRVLAWVQALGFAEVAVGLRLRLHDWADFLLQGAGWYAGRQAFQKPLLLGLVSVMLVWVIAASFHWAGRGVCASVAVLASSVSLALFAIETVSLHQVDQVFYAKLGPFLLIAVLWAATAGMTGAAALLSRRN